MVSFAQPAWIVSGLIAGPLLWLWWRRQEARRRKRLETFVAVSLLGELTGNVSPKRRTIKKLLLLAAVFCCFLALARPQFGTRWIDVKHKGIDILFALDTSRSMLAEDLRPSRLERSKYAIMDFVSHLAGDRVGLLPFAGSAYLICPLTADYHAFEQSLMAIDTSIIPAGGTDISQAIGTAETVLSNEANHKILILITDGENLQGNAIEAAAAAGRQGMTIYTVGVGTADGELIPDQRGGGFIRDSSGSFVKSRLDEEMLQAIAASTAGLYVPLGSQGQGLTRIYEQKLALVPKEELAEKRRKVPIERCEWPLAAALVLVAAEFLLSDRRRRLLLPRPVRLFTRLRTAVRGAFVSAALALLLAPGPLPASPGETAFEAGEYRRAADYYRTLLEQDPDNPVVLYNTGAAAYKESRFDDAAAAFDRALATDDLDLQEKAYYNKGNSLFRQGEQSLPSDPEYTVRSWQEALDSFTGALELNPDDDNARFNRDHVATRLEQLRHQQQQQQKQQPGEGEESEQEPDQNERSEQGSPADNEAESSPDQSDPSPGPELGDQERQEQERPDPSPADAQPQDEAEPSEPESRDRRDEASADGKSAAQSTETVPPPGMTREEAEKLLQAVQSEEGRLNLFAPRPPGSESELKRDW